MGPQGQGRKVPGQEAAGPGFTLQGGSHLQVGVGSGGSWSRENSLLEFGRAERAGKWGARKWGLQWAGLCPFRMAGPGAESTVSWASPVGVCRVGVRSGPHQDFPVEEGWGKMGFRG